MCLAPVLFFCLYFLHPILAASGADFSRCLANLNNTMVECAATANCTGQACGTNAIFSNCLHDNAQHDYPLALGDLTFTDGTPIDSPENAKYATGITSKACLSQCGHGAATATWRVFAIQFSAWVVPWLALLCQLPFGCMKVRDNIIALALTVGSPTLASYSLAITSLNSTWIFKRLREVTWPSTHWLISILRSMQQVPLLIRSSHPGLLCSLVVLPQNDKFWENMHVRLESEDSHWNIPAIASISWVFIVYMFTIAVSFTDLVEFKVTVAGQAVGCSWIWLITLVSGWLILSPKSIARRHLWCLENATRIHARLAPRTIDEVPVEMVAITQDRGLEIRNYDAYDSLHHDQMCSSPVFNYARIYSWTRSAEYLATHFENASSKFNNHIPVSRACWIAEEPEKNRLGTLEDVISYCRDSSDSLPRRPSIHRRIDIVFASFMAVALQSCVTAAAVIAFWYTPAAGIGCRSIIYITHGGLSIVVWMIMLLSSHLANFAENHAEIERHDRDETISFGSSSSTEFQGISSSQASSNSIQIRTRQAQPTTGAAPVELEEKKEDHVPALSYMIKFTPPLQRLHPRARFYSILLRVTGKSIAFFNSFIFVGVTILQFSGQLDSCYCQSFSVSYLVLTPLRKEGNASDPGYAGTVKALERMSEGFVTAITISGVVAVCWILWIMWNSPRMIAGAGRLWDTTMRKRTGGLVIAGTAVTDVVPRR
ncbi:hypothetical protein DL96DRAFT_1588623 [Flagelloscypha sp. PMI_526]|nr:hypothetical protein DL96DRAFT_1588623 [Flagelloscypha sp. PMI_526]